MDRRAGDSFSRFGIQKPPESVTVALSPELDELAGFIDRLSKCKLMFQAIVHVFM